MKNLRGRTFVFLGKSGSGKDTQSRNLAECAKDMGLETITISTGDLGRKLAAKKTFVGRWVKGILDRGDFFPNWLQIGLWFEALKDELTEDGAVFFPSSPRLLQEAKQLDEVMENVGRPKPVPVYFDISDDESMQRLLKRGRADDDEPTIKARLKNFEKHVLPIVEWYGRRVVKIDGHGTREDVWERLLKKLK